MTERGGNKRGAAEANIKHKTWKPPAPQKITQRGIRLTTFYITNNLKTSIVVLFK